MAPITNAMYPAHAFKNSPFIAKYDKTKQQQNGLLLLLRCGLSNRNALLPFAPRSLKPSLVLSGRREAWRSAWFPAVPWSARWAFDSALRSKRQRKDEASPGLIQRSYTALALGSFCSGALERRRAKLGCLCVSQVWPRFDSMGSHQAAITLALDKKKTQKTVASCHLFEEKKCTKVFSIFQKL